MLYLSYQLRNRLDNINNKMIKIMKIFIVSNLLNKLEDNSRKRVKALLDEIKDLPAERQAEIICQNL